MAYTWEEVMLGIDVRRETQQKQEDIESIEAKAKKEQDMMSAWGLGLSLLGGALFGPVGYFLGKQLGTYGADYAYDWESEVVDTGKFNKDEIEEFNKSIETDATSQTQGQYLNTAIDLATMYVQAGGLKEGFDPSIGGGDWTTFGTGDDAWTVFGSNTTTGAPFIDDTISTSLTPGAELTPVFPGTKGLFSGGLKETSKRLTTAAGSEKAVRGIESGGKDLQRLIKEG